MDNPETNPNNPDLGIAGAVVPQPDTGIVPPIGEKTDTFAVPQEYAEKGYAKDLKSIDDVWKKLDGSQALIGQRTVPDEKSTPEQWVEHYKSLGMPEEAGKYNFNRDSFSDEFKNSQSDEYDSAVKAIFLKAGLNQKQVDIIQPDVEKLAEQIQIQKAEADAQADKAFDELTEKTFGTNKDQIIADTSQLLKELTPEGFAEKVAGLDNETLVILSGVLNNVKQKYINEDGSGGDGNPVGGQTIEDLRILANTKMQSDEYRNSFNTKSDEARKEVREIFEKIAALQAKQNA